MPKEVIQWGGTTRLEDDESVILHTEPTLQVKWFHDPDHVQVQFDVSPEYLAQMVADNCPTVTSNILSRREINHMIKTLRRARDAAYGADE